MPAPDFARFVELAREGKPRPTWEAPADIPRGEAEQIYQKSEVERSIQYCKKVLGLGLKG